MNGIERVRPLMGRILHEHTELKHILHTLDEVFRATGSSLPEKQRVYQGRLTDLREFLKAHFEEEECGGCMEEALSLAPHLAAEAASLEHEHAQLLHELDELLTKNAAAPTPQAWRQNEAACAAFVNHVLMHEGRETRLLQKGFNADLELEDK